MRLERVDAARCDWQRLDAYPDRVLFQTRAWLDFLAASQGAEPVVAALLDGETTVGWFTGATVKRSGIRILGSPFPGWTTPSMGFNLDPDVPHRQAVEALLPFAFKELGCLHVELKDRQLELGDVDGLGFAHSETTTYEIDLEPDEAAILGNMSTSARRNVRQGERYGVTIEEASDVGFADDFFEQLLDVFAKQSLRPPYDADRIRALIETVHPSGNLLLLRSRDEHGRCIATGIFPGFNGVAYFWGGASFRRDQKLRPNEMLFWHALRHWKARGATVLDTAGGGEYKLKYGVRGTLHVPFLRRARLPGMLPLRDIAERVLTRGRR